MLIEFDGTGKYTGPESLLAEKDREDLEFGLALGVDLVALSFVRRSEDLEDARAIIERGAGRAEPWTP